MAKEHELVSLGGQAAAAAHSLGTPLSTIKIISQELFDQLHKDKNFTKDEKRVELQYILKQKPKGHAQISQGLTIDLNEIKGYYGRFQTGAIHTSNFGLKGDLSKDFFSVQLSGYMMDGIERKNFTFVIYSNGKIRFSGGFLGSKNLKRQPEALRKYLIDTYTQKQQFLYNEIQYNNIAGFFNTNVNFDLTRITRQNPIKAQSVRYETETTPFLYMTYKDHNFVLSSKSVMFMICLTL